MDRDATTMHLTPAEAGAWDAFVRRSPQGTLFVRPDWLKIYAEVFGVEPRMHCLMDGGEILAGALLLFRRKGPWKLSTAMPIGAYHGPIFNPSVKPGNRDELSAAFSRLRSSIAREVSLYSASLHPMLADVEPERQKGWTTASLATYTLDISEPDTVWSGMSQSLRRKLRRGAERNELFEESTDVRRLVELHHASYTRKGQQPPLPSPLLHAWLERMLRAGLIRLFLLRDAGGNVAAMRAVACDGGTAYDLVAGMDPGAAAENASHLLVWRVIEHLAGEGCETLDFMGGNSAGPAEFKRSFGSGRTPYLTMHYRGSGAIRLAEETRAFFVRRRRGV